MLLLLTYSQLYITAVAPRREAGDAATDRTRCSSKHGTCAIAARHVPMLLQQARPSKIQTHSNDKTHSDELDGPAAAAVGALGGGAPPRVSPALRIAARRAPLSS